MPERRLNARQRSFMQGRIFFNQRRSSKDCVIRDFGLNGARLEFTDTVGVPDKFEVYVPSKEQYFQAHVAWRKGNGLGISWAGEESPPPRQDNVRSGAPLADRVAKLEQEVAALRKRLDALQG